jgi:hypothetical protein
MFLPVVVMTREILLEECISVMDIREKGYLNAWKRLLEGGKRQEGIRRMDMTDWA